jgi:hypothetical protein
VRVAKVLDKSIIVYSRRWNAGGRETFISHPCSASTHSGTPCAGGDFLCGSITEIDGIDCDATIDGRLISLLGRLEA